ncbi:eceriferum 1-like protein [Tanacetum coccineum]
MTAKGKNRIVDKTIEFEQVDRERNWDDQIIFNGLLVYVGYHYLECAKHVPLWRLDGIIIVILLHVGAVEFLYYWLHRALHHHFLYNRYHSHHHSSIATEPITSVTHPFAEHIAYFLLFAIPMVTITLTGTVSVIAVAGYHSLHHTQFRTNYALFMPFYDYIYGTMDKSSDTLYEKSLIRKEESPNVVHLTHLTTPESIYHTRLGFASLASKPHTSYKWYLWILWPITVWSTLITRLYGKTFVVERNVFKNLKLQTWAIPKYKIQYHLEWQRQSINGLIEEAILEAEAKGVKVFTLGLLNQGDELNRSGELFIRRNPQLKVKVVDGSSLAVAVVAISRDSDYEMLKSKFKPGDGNDKLVLSRTYSHKTWLVGDGLSKEEQVKASKGTLIIPYSQFPPKKVRKDCFYYTTPSMLTPKYLENVDSCENWLPRRVMSAWRIAGKLMLRRLE